MTTSEFLNLFGRTSTDAASKLHSLNQSIFIDTEARLSRLETRIQDIKKIPKKQYEEGTK